MSAKSPFLETGWYLPCRDPVATKGFLIGENMTHVHESRPHYSIRTATVEDVESIRRMQADSWKDTYENAELGVTKQWLEQETDSWLTDESLAKSRVFLDKIFHDRTQFYRVATRDEKVVGIIHFGQHDDGTKHLWGLYTDSTTHGTGLAQLLMAESKEWVGDAEVDLEVASYNTRAIKFYQKYGFVVDKELDEKFKEKIPTVRMVRKRRET